LRQRGVRVEVDTPMIECKRRSATRNEPRLPFMLIAGDDDVAAGAVSFRYRDGTQNNGVAIDAAAEEIVTAINDRVRV